MNCVKRKSLDEIQAEVFRLGYCAIEWEMIDFEQILDSSQDSLAYFSLAIADLGLACLPKVVKTPNGYTVANLDKSVLGNKLVFSKPIAYLDKNKEEIRLGLLKVRIAAEMAAADGKITFEEVDVTRTHVYELPNLTESEKYSLMIRALYFLYSKHKHRDLLSDFEYCSPNLQEKMINLAKSVAIADSRIDKNERSFLAELYRLSDKPTKSVYTDLKQHARTEGIDIHSQKNSMHVSEPTPTEAKVTAIDNDESILDSLIDEFFG
ncbi:TerB family tellurite resistance protein [Vibrio breoganii]